MTEINHMSWPKLVELAKGTMWEGLGLDERPQQGVSPFPYLTLAEMIRFHGAQRPLSRALRGSATSAERALGPLGKSIRILLSTTRTDGAGGA